LPAGDYVLGRRTSPIANTPAALSVLEPRCKTSPRKNTQAHRLVRGRDGSSRNAKPKASAHHLFHRSARVMARYSVTIHAGPAKSDPVLLSERTASQCGDERVPAMGEWQEFFPKPCYLFAMVAAKLLTSSRTQFITRSGRHVRLAIYVDPASSPCGFAMQALKKSMKWD